MKVMTRPGPSPADVAELTTAGVCGLAVAAAVATSTSYVLHLELPVVARDVGSSLPVIGVVAALPIGGHLFGLALLVPLADRMRSHRLISGQLSVLAAGLLLAAIAATPLMLGAGLFVSGLSASTGAQMSSLAGRYSQPSRRGRAVGTVTAGISAGIVLGRVLGGTLADRCGWRAMLLVFAAACLVLALAAAAILPRTAMLLAALAVFDAGLFSAQVANQSTVLGIDPGRPAQFNGAYMVVYFIGGSVGTAIGGSLIDLVGWAGIGLTATTALTVAASVVLLSGRTFTADRE
jgi:predicted MFS family arabinose efflux permease